VVLTTHVVTMDADVMITMAFSFEVFLFALAAGPYIVHEVRKSRLEVAVETGRERLDPSRADDAAEPRPATARARGGRGVLP
jgi:hypothetical protein